MSHCQPIHDAAASRRRGTAIRCVGLVGGGYPNWLGVRYCAAKNNWQWTLRESECRWWTCCGRVTGGQGGRFGEKVWHVPKLELLARLQTLLEMKRLRIADRMREAGTLGRELLNIKSARRASGRLKVGAEGAGEHDDLALRWRWRCGPEGRRWREAAGNIDWREDYGGRQTRRLRRFASLCQSPPARWRAQNANQAMIAAIGIVSTQAPTMLVAIPHRTALRRLMLPTPAIAPAMA
jgi:hypothetical protein